MRFISKNGNLHIILRPGLSAQPLTGSPATPTISVRFQDGVANVEDAKLSEMMLNHPGFNRDFVAADESGTDPYAYLREDSEPTHVLTEMQYGHPVNRNVSPVKKKLPPEIAKMIQEQATEIAKQMLPGMVESVLQSIVNKKEGEAKEEAEAKDESEVTTKKRGRPSKAEETE